MRKGKFGINYAFYALFAFLLAIVGQAIPITLLLGFVIVAEQDEWLTKQVIQAWVLSIVTSVVSVATTAISIFYSIPILGTIFSGFISIIAGIITIIVVVIAIINAIKVSKGQDAQIPFGTSLANFAYKAVEQTVYRNQEMDT